MLAVNEISSCSERTIKLFVVKCKHSLAVIVYVANVTNEKLWLMIDELRINVKYINTSLNYNKHRINTKS